jgi:hypothetical protein
MDSLAMKGSCMLGERTRDAVLEQEFLPLRAKILEIAAGLDRLDRATAAGDDGGRRERLEKAIQLLLADEPSRAARVQLLFSRDYDEDWRTRFEL